MDDIIGEQRKRAFIPISASLLSLVIGVAISWNALDGQVSNKIALDPKSVETVGSIGDFLKQRCTGSTAYVYVGKREGIKSLGLRTTWKKPLVNGALDGRLVKVEVY